MPFDFGGADTCVDPTPRVKPHLFMDFAFMATVSTRTILAVFVRLDAALVSMLMSAMAMILVLVRMKRVALHVNPPVEIAVGFVDHGLRKVGLGVAQQYGQEIFVGTSLGHQAGWQYRKQACGGRHPHGGKACVKQMEMTVFHSRLRSKRIFAKRRSANEYTRPYSTTRPNTHHSTPPHPCTRR